MTEKVRCHILWNAYKKNSIIFEKSNVNTIIIGVFYSQKRNDCLAILQFNTCTCLTSSSVSGQGINIGAQSLQTAK